MFHLKANIDEASFPCVNCGACTYVCPTLCFDIADNLLKLQENVLKHGILYVC